MYSLVPQKMASSCLVILLATLFTLCQAMELPKFDQMKIMYPGYFLYGGHYRDKDIIKLIGANPNTTNLHNTASIRMSWVLNKYGGRHAIGTEPILLSKQGVDSILGPEGQQFIFRNTAFGPFLAEKYRNPLTAKPNKQDHTKTMDPFHGKQGIVRLVSYRRNHAAGHVGLWDCNHFYQSRDWTSEKHIIGVEFWETPDSYCPPNMDETPPVPQLVTVKPGTLIRLIPRYNLGSQYLHPEGRNRKKLRHSVHNYEPSKKSRYIWQEN